MKIPGNISPVSAAGLGITSPVAAPGKAPPSGGPQFADVLSSMMSDFDMSLRSAEKLSVGALTGDVPLQKVVEAVVAAEQKVQLTTSVRDKIVAAYLELTRMPI
ncbi:MAG: flagellar hook-basal body complex protein FliE [Hyphomicrobium sp.]|nr:flagellar hook-basal body complex protein FliE [Hyphomicrobium sp.]